MTQPALTSTFAIGLAIVCSVIMPRSLQPGGEEGTRSSERIFLIDIESSAPD